MKILVLGAGLMGPATAFHALGDAQVTKLVLADRSAGALEASQGRLRALVDDGRFSTLVFDLADEGAAGVFAGFDLVIAAMPMELSVRIITVAAASGTPLVDLNRPPEKDHEVLARRVEDAGALVLFGCGVDPGLTEILARNLADRLDRVDEVHIKCGGLPEKPEPPLNYRIVFGGRQLPLREEDAWAVEEGRLIKVPRYQDVEPVDFEGIGEFEAYHEGFMPWLFALPSLRGLRRGSQKTLRWPGYIEKVRTLRELGLLGLAPVEVDGVSVIPRHFLDSLLEPKLRMRPGDRDLTLLRVDVRGEKGGLPTLCRAQMIDHPDEKRGISSMARVTAFTASILGRMVVRGELEGVGLLTPEAVVGAAAFERLLDELAQADIRIDLSCQ